ncbi:transposase [Nonomuraea sp. NPDC052116]|uniref:transposase n=1 Tax=Nonomuraea sp. NPDC052116 TaxID=3155665 RepID=UPI00341ABB9F
MPALRKCPDELRERAVRMVFEVREQTGQAPGAIARVAQQLGVHREALRSWVRQSEIDGGQRPGTSTEDAQRIAELEREVRELRVPAQQGPCLTSSRMMIYAQISVHVKRVPSGMGHRVPEVGFQVESGLFGGGGQLRLLPAMDGVLVVVVYALGELVKGPVVVLVAVVRHGVAHESSWSARSRRNATNGM